MDEPGVIYEVTIACDPSIAGEVRDWLGSHVAEMLELPGFTGASILEVAPAAADDWPRYTVHYRLTDRSALEDYFSTHAERMRARGPGSFGDAIRTERRILTAAGAPDAPAPPRCLNCGQVLHGQYCGLCGQRSSSRLISLWGLISEGLGDLLDVDSRLWRTLRALLLRPGYLTAEYLEGRRARFMPPFRMYLAFSLIFFVVAFFGVDEMQVVFDGDADPAQREAVEEAANELAAGIDERLAVRMPDEDIDRRVGELEERVAQDEGPRVEIGGGAAATCEELDFEASGWLGERLTEERLREACRRVVADRGRNLARAMVDDLPTALFAFLPVLAFVLQLLYPLSRRYYVEHLLFIVHYQSFVFLIMTLQLLFSRLTDLVTVGWLSFVTGIAVTFYIPFYLYRSLRRVYQQGFFATFVKFVLLSFAYFIAFAILMVVTFAVAALSL